MLGKGKNIRVKVFKSFVKPDRLVKEINDWLVDEGAELTMHDIKYSVCGVGMMSIQFDAMAIYSIQE